MILKIARKQANIDNGACTKYANFFHGLFLLAFVLLLPMVINIIPLAALGAMLVSVSFSLVAKVILPYLSNRHRSYCVYHNDY
jgi:MFS superfamily sulfate permease-like transporter